MFAQIQRVLGTDEVVDLRRKADVPQAGAKMRRKEGFASGFTAATRVAAPMGWRAVEALTVGDMVMTLDAGWLPVHAIHRQGLWCGLGDCPVELQPLTIPAGVFGSSRPVILMPQQFVLFEEELAADLYGSFSVALPAAQLNGFFGIERIKPQHPIDVIAVELEEDEVLLAEGGAMVLCPSACGCGRYRMEELLREGVSGAEATYPILSPLQSLEFLRALSRSRNGAAAPQPNYAALA